jgi:rare lipoprotein A
MIDNKRFFLMMLLGSTLLLGCQRETPDEQFYGVSQPKDVPYTAKSYQPAKSHHPFTPTQHDGAPKGRLPKTFKPVKPKAEPLSVYGNPDSYSVNGHTYHVRRSLGGYRTQGLASWYGTKFHSRRTSSGEAYDMYALTAAHKTLPIPCYVRVRNLNTGQTAVVKVNDRGPFHEGRVIDLSYGAASKLGLLPKGTAPVEIEALLMPGQQHIAHYYVQAGAFISEQLALLLQKKLSQITPSPVFIEKTKEKYIVRVGPFGERQMTDDLKQILASNGVHGSFSMLL